jgi:LysM repeat protein
MTKLQTISKNKTLIINFLLVILFCFFNHYAFAQEVKESISFLVVELETAQDERRIDILNELALRIENTEQAKKYAQEALALAPKMDYKDGIASALVALGELYKYTEHTVLPTDSLAGLAAKYGTSVKSILISSYLLDEAIFEGQLLKIQTVENIAKAEESFLKALEIRKAQAFADGQVWALLRLASLFEISGNLNKAEKYFLEIVKIRESNITDKNVRHLHNALTELSVFYYRCSLTEKVPSEKAFFIRKEEETREKILQLPSNDAYQKLIEVIDMGNFYWQYRNRINKAEKYLKQGVEVAKNMKKHENEAYNALWNFYKKQGQRYFASEDHELAELFFKKYVQTVKDFHLKNDSLASQEIANAYLHIADFYKSRYKTIGSEIYTIQSISAVLATKNQQKINWLKDRLLKIYSPQVVLDSSTKQNAKALYSEDFKNILLALPSTNHPEIKQLALQKIIDYGSFLGNPAQMTTFYNSLIQNSSTEIDIQLKLYLNIIEVIENQEDKNNTELKKYCQKVIALVEPIKNKNSLHHWYLAKVHFALGNKQTAIESAWKSLQNISVEPNRLATYLTEKQLKDAQNILAQLLQFDEVTDATFIVHTVEKSETLTMIQAMYNVSEDCLKDWNYLTSNVLVEGMKIKVCKKKDWVRNHQSSEEFAANTPIFHIVNRGETLENIAKRYSKTIAQLQSLNNNTLTTVALGQKILVGKYFMQCSCAE